ncbi:hypothetical protein [Candidatus Oscillochloris fontis]|uniref:hypothetical protein n=1 Tax=Candidatus Oscillochloris fontis TaxID=2496868 RepID=UPI00101C4FC7|nr:hypothetical protein [Candidatus Oscillochloris fontis]
MHDDIVIVLSQTMLQVALEAYTAENFTDQVFHFTSLGVSFLGKDIRLEIQSDKAILFISVLSRFQVKVWNKALTERRAPLVAEVQVSFTVQDGQLFVQIGEGVVRIQGAELIEKVATSAVNILVQQLFSKPIIQLPIQIDTVTKHANSTDESHIALQSVTLQRGALRVAFILKNEVVPYPTAFHGSTQQRYQRSRAINVTASAVESYNQGMVGRAAGLLIKAVCEADPSYELGWLWLSLLVKTQPERKYCLERALQINPLNSKLSQELDAQKYITAVAPNLNDYDMFS